MLKIYIVRHGQDNDNAQYILNGRRDEQLTAIGKKQAHETANKIITAGIVFTTIYTSPLRRAHKTAKIIAKKQKNLSPIVMPGLIEREFGVMTGKPHARIKELCSPDILETDTVTYFLHPEGAETFPELMTRAAKVLAKIKRIHKTGNILLVTHGDLGKMMYASYYHLDWVEVLKMFHFGNLDVLELSAESTPKNTHVHKIIQHNL